MCCMCPVRWAGLQACTPRPHGCSPWSAGPTHAGLKGKRSTAPARPIYALRPIPTLRPARTLAVSHKPTKQLRGMPRGPNWPCKAFGGTTWACVCCISISVAPAIGLRLRGSRFQISMILLYGTNHTDRHTWASWLCDETGGIEHRSCARQSETRVDVRPGVKSPTAARV